jgi:hypothetical protein
MKSKRKTPSATPTYGDYLAAFTWATLMIADNSDDLAEYRAQADAAGEPLLTTLIFDLFQAEQKTNCELLAADAPLSGQYLALPPDRKIRRGHAWVLHPDGVILEHGPLLRMGGEWAYPLKEAHYIRDAIVHVMVIGARDQ